MIYDMRLIKISEDLYDLYINEKIYRNITKEEATDLIFENDHDFPEPISP